MLKAIVYLCSVKWTSAAVRGNVNMGIHERYHRGQWYCVLCRCMRKRPYILTRKDKALLILWVYVCVEKCYTISGKKSYCEFKYNCKHPIFI